MIGKPREEHASGDPRQHRPDVEDDDAQHRDDPALENLSPVACRHEAGQELGRTEEGEADADKAHGAHHPGHRQSMFTHGAEQGRVDRADRRHHFTPATRLDDSHDRQHEEAQEHEDTLQHVAVRHGLEAADAGVQQDHARADQHASLVAHAHEGRERLPRCGELCGRVGPHHAEDDDRAYDPDDVGAVRKAVGQVVGNRDRVVAVGELLEGARHQRPGEGHANHFAQHDPEGVEADQVPHPGQPQQQPPALAGGVRRKRDHPRRELLARDVEALDRPAFAAGPPPDPDQDREVEDEDADDRAAGACVTHGNLSSRCPPRDGPDRRPRPGPLPARCSPASAARCRWAARRSPGGLHCGAGPRQSRHQLVHLVRRNQQ